ncbi:zinc-dependent metalloprotease [Kocuria rhizophila]|nr:zinc-dependent metalloprotease [Kocuria rhizophila]
MFVAPNALVDQQELNVSREDFRLWACLHEQTHGRQSAAAPWLRDDMLGQISPAGSPDATAWQRLRSVGASLAAAPRTPPGRGNSVP